MPFFRSASPSRKRLRPGRFDPGRGRWDYVDPASKATHAHAITLATFNVWFGEQHFEERFLAVLALLERRRPDVIALQECTIPFLAGLRSSPWVRSEYVISDFHGTTLSNPTYGVVMLSRLPVESMELYDLPTRMGRRMLLARLLVNDMKLAVGTVHLESLDSAEYRGRQLQQIFKTLKDEEAAVLMGDFNFCSTWDEEQANLDPDYVDVWPALRDGDPGWTENTDVNLMLAGMLEKKAGEPEQKTVRFDRVLLRSGEPGWVPESVELLGTAPISPQTPDVFPSDHFGLHARLLWRD